MKKILLILIATILLGSAFAKVDLTTLPGRDTPQLTIYNSADLTLVRDGRSLTLKEGGNKLQFSWANTLIDPTSLSMLPKAHADKIDIANLTFPPRVQNLGIWNIQSEIGGSVPVEITYLTSGLSWRAFYMGTLAEDEKTMHLQGYVRVTNNSGEDYENAQTRLIVGQVHLLDEIAELARRQYPYGRPGQVPPPIPQPRRGGVERLRMLQEAVPATMDMAAGRPKEITKEGLSEYFLYTIEGTETIPDRWSKRLPSFAVNEIPVRNLYKFEEDRYGPAVIRYLSFANDEAHELGQTPVPGGMLKVYRTVDSDRHLSYEGQSSFKYIPVGEEIELNLGAVADVIVEPKLMDLKTDNYSFNSDGNIDGCEEIRTFELSIKNTRSLPVTMEITRNLGTADWDVKTTQDAAAAYEKVDLDTIRYTLTMPPQTEKTIVYEVRTYHGRRTEVRARRERR